MHFIAKTKEGTRHPPSPPNWEVSCFSNFTHTKKEFPTAYLELPHFPPNQNGTTSAENPKTSSVFRSTSLFVPVAN